MELVANIWESILLSDIDGARGACVANIWESMELVANIWESIVLVANIWESILLVANTWQRKLEATPPSVTR